MKAAIVKVNAKYQITLTYTVREKLTVKAGYRLLLDVQDGMILLIPEPKSYADHLQGLQGEIWQGVDVHESLEK